MLAALPSRPPRRMPMPPRFPRFAPFLLLAAVVFGPGCMALQGRLHRPAEITGTDRLRHDGYYFEEEYSSTGEGTTIQAYVFWADGTTVKVDLDWLRVEGSAPVSPYYETAEQAHEALQTRLRALSGAQGDPGPGVDVAWGTYQALGDALQMRFVFPSEFLNPSKYTVHKITPVITSDTTYTMSGNRLFRFRPLDGLPASQNWTMQLRR